MLPCGLSIRVVISKLYFIEATFSAFTAHASFVLFTTCYTWQEWGQTFSRNHVSVCQTVNEKILVLMWMACTCIAVTMLSLEHRMSCIFWTICRTSGAASYTFEWSTCAVFSYLSSFLSTVSLPWEQNVFLLFTGRFIFLLHDGQSYSSLTVDIRTTEQKHNFSVLEPFISSASYFCSKVFPSPLWVSLALPGPSVDLCLFLGRIGECSGVLNCTRAGSPWISCS